MLSMGNLIPIALNVTTHSKVLIAKDGDWKVEYGTFMITFETRDVGLNPISLESSSSSGS